MQPRDFLSATFLYAILLLGVVGLALRGGDFRLPAYTSFNPEDWCYLAPVLFITVACGACSGFHSIVSSGTTAKQIQTEQDVKKVSYGAMLVEGLLAVFALACIGISGSMDGGPVAAFARGSAIFFGVLGIPESVGVTFATLAVSTFLLTTLDTCTRLTRFLIEELFDWHSVGSRYWGTLLVLVLPAWAAFMTFSGPDGVVLPVWKAVWPLFGATNQLLAALALITFYRVFEASQDRLWLCAGPNCNHAANAVSCLAADGNRVWFAQPAWRNRICYDASGRVYGSRFRRDFEARSSF